MRLGVYVSGAFAAMALVLGYLFRVMHLPDAHELLIVGLGVAAVVFIPLFAAYNYKRRAHSTANV
ncbi:hypothetical protein [uncultured Pontibacter sp.]|uniref:GldL-related protein n=1 Tax=uncultured Pontibacter sp. TaxID=453356 RepID=UPI00260278BE|nr:hypothetical protein [uncultured Pontibacter sp.]